MTQPDPTTVGPAVADDLRDHKAVLTGFEPAISASDGDPVRVGAVRRLARHTSRPPVVTRSAVVKILKLGRFASVSDHDIGRLTRRIRSRSATI